MTTGRRYFSGEFPPRNILPVVTVGLITAAIFVSIGVLEMGFSGFVGTIVFWVIFGLLPGIAGWVCGWYQLGFPAAAGSGVAPGVAFFVVGGIGATLNVGSFGGGDSPLGPLALVLTAPGILAATIGFVLAVVIATVQMWLANG